MSRMARAKSQPENSPEPSKSQPENPSPAVRIITRKIRPSRSTHSQKVELLPSRPNCNQKVPPTPSESQSESSPNPRSRPNHKHNPPSYPESSPRAVRQLDSYLRAVQITTRKFPQAVQIIITKLEKHAPSRPNHTVRSHNQKDPPKPSELQAI